MIVSLNWQLYFGIASDFGDDGVIFRKLDVRNQKGSRCIPKWFAAEELAGIQGQSSPAVLRDILGRHFNNLK